MDTAQLRQEINQQLDQLSNDRLRLVADFIGNLTQKEKYEQTSSDADAQLPSHYRPPSGKSLLNHTETWVGEDFEECLQAVYKTRSQIQP